MICDLVYWVLYAPIIFTIGFYMGLVWRGFWAKSKRKP